MAEIRTAHLFTMTLAVGEILPTLSRFERQS
jgi:hypothetical protein